MRYDAAGFEPSDIPFGLKLSQKFSRDRCRMALASCGPRKGGFSQSDPDRMVGRLERRSALFKQFKLADHSPLDDSKKAGPRRSHPIAPPAIKRETIKPPRNVIQNAATGLRFAALSSSSAMLTNPIGRQQTASATPATSTTSGILMAVRALCRSTESKRPCNSASDTTSCK